MSDYFKYNDATRRWEMTEDHPKIVFRKILESLPLYNDLVAKLKAEGLPAPASAEETINHFFVGISANQMLGVIPAK